MLASGLHPTLAGVILALFIPTRPPANLKALTAQANAIVAAEAKRGGEVLRQGPSLPALRALDAIHDRLESPADRLLRHAGARSSYLVLPIFALANAGVAMTAGVFGGRERLMAAIVVGLTIGKPLGIVAASSLAVRLKVALKPAEYSWTQLARRRRASPGSASRCLCLSPARLFQPRRDFDAAKIAIFVASVLSAVIGVTLLSIARRKPA